MVSVRISRQAAEVGADSGAPASVSRVTAEVGTVAGGASTNAALVSRQAIEVAAQNPQRASVTRVAAEVGAVATAGSGNAALISRQVIEVAASLAAAASVTRVTAEVGAAAGGASGNAARVSRQGFEVAARRAASGIVVPLSLPTDTDLFLHNWASEVVVRTAYVTDVGISGDTGAEARVGLREKPERTLTLVWEEGGNRGDPLIETDRARLDLLYHHVRRLTDERLPIPFYPHQRDLDRTYLSTDTQVFFDTTTGPWHIGARVVIVQVDYRGRYKSHSFHTIADRESDRITLSAQLGVPVALGSFIVPMIDCEVVLEARMEAPRGCLARVELDVVEIQGPSQLPPSTADVPATFYEFDGVPILDVLPDWSEPVKQNRSRQGQEYQQGRERRVVTSAARSRLAEEVEYLFPRERAWHAIQFFDGRRGRLRTFWKIDEDHHYVPAAIDPTGTFVSVKEVGALADFQAELDWVGLEMQDGTFYVREAVTVQLLGGNFRITVNPALPAGLNVADVVRINRARRVRFDSDEMEQTWSHAGLMQTTLPYMEALEEGEVTT